MAYPQLAENPVHSFAPALAELSSRIWDQGTEHFPPTTFQVSNISAGTGAPNVIPGELQGTVQHPLLARADAGRPQGSRSSAFSSKHRVRYTLEWFVSGEPFFTPPGRAFGGDEQRQ